MTERLHVWYVLSRPASGAALGAVTNFALNRFWSFGSDPRCSGVPRPAATLLVSAGSLGLNMLGVYAFTAGTGLKYGFSKIITAILVGLFFNFPLHRRYVFK